MLKLMICVVKKLDRANIIMNVKKRAKEPVDKLAVKSIIKEQLDI